MSEIQGSQFEISIYKVLIIAIIGVLVSIGIGAFMGRQIGFSAGIESVEVHLPDYCAMNHVGSEVTITCNELEGVTVADLCKILSPELEAKTKVLILR